MESRSKSEDLVITLVELALTRPEGEREEYLRSACGTNSELFAQAWSYVQWEKRMSGFLLDPLRGPPTAELPFHPGDFLLQRFRIVREIAQGGMGVVWEAFDEKLDRRVALKCAKAGFGSQLPPEVRNARDISHPNVCNIFEIHTVSTAQGDIDFIAMEFLEGETLASRLRRPLESKAVAAEIARQLCAGLGEAHRNGVVHGDLKSNNVILTEAPNGSVRAVITDFGLAQRSAPGGPRMATKLAGTPAYMAPELWKGVPCSIASDIYALGVILWELKTGKKASELGVTSSTLSWDERLAWKPPPGHGRWERTIACCLDPDAAKRFKSAEAVDRALGPSQAKRWVMAAVLAMLLITLTALAVHRFTAAPRQTVRLAVLPFASTANAAGMASKLWRDTTGQISRLKGNARTTFTAVPAAENGGSAANIADGTTHVIHVNLDLDRSRALIHAYLIEAKSGVTVREWSEEYTSGEMRYAAAAMASFVAESLRLPPLVLHPVVNSKARGDYAKGILALRRDTGVDAALDAMGKAADEDSDSPLPYAGLAEAQWRKYFLTKKPAWLVRAKQSAGRAERRNPDVAEVQRIWGLLEASAGHYEEAITTYLRAAELDPRNSDGYRRLGLAYQAVNQLVDAQTALQKAAALDPDYYRAQQDLGSFYFQKGDYDEAIKRFRRAVELAPAEPNVRFALANAYVNCGMYGDAERELRSAIRMKPTADSLETMGLVLIYERQEAEAIPYLLRASQLAPEWPLPFLHLGLCYRRTGQRAEEERANQHGLAAAERDVASNPRRGNARAFLAYLCAAVGDRDRAESEIAQARLLAPFDADTQFMAVLTYEALQYREEALSVLGASSKEVLADLSRWPDLADLHQDSRFLELLTSHGLK